MHMRTQAFSSGVSCACREPTGALCEPSWWGVHRFVALAALGPQAVFACHGQHSVGSGVHASQRRAPILEEFPPL